MTEENAHVLAIDLGTSGPKVAVINRAGEIVSRGRGVLWARGPGARRVKANRAEDGRLWRTRGRAAHGLPARHGR